MLSTVDTPTLHSVLSTTVFASVDIAVEAVVDKSGSSVMVVVVGGYLAVDYIHSNTQQRLYACGQKILKFYIKLFLFVYSPMK